MKFQKLFTVRLNITGQSLKNINELKSSNYDAAGTSVLSAVFSSASFGSAISVIGLPATIPLGGVAGGFALVSSGLIVASKKLDSKIKKHQEIVTLAIAKHVTLLIGCCQKR